MWAATVHSFPQKLLLGKPGDIIKGCRQNGDICLIILKWSNNGVFCHFALHNFLSAQKRLDKSYPKVVLSLYHKRRLVNCH